MLLQKQDIRFMNAAAHEGKLIIIATDTAGCLWYTVKQDGFEDSYLHGDPAKRTGWEGWAPVELPNEDDDTSVLAREQATCTREDVPGVLLLRSRYKSKTLGAPAPVQLVSGNGHLYIFRQSTAGTLLCDRFVLDGMTNKLGRKLEVRFKRSRKRYEPANPGKLGAIAADSLDFRDSNGVLFYEPTLELCLVSSVSDGWFAVERVPTNEHEQYRWHFFSYNTVSKKIDALTLRASDEGLFELHDYLVFDEPSADGSPPIPRSIPGILRRSISVSQAVIVGGPAATKYDLQQERLASNGSMQLVRTSTRLMLTVPTDKGLAAFSFGLATDGTLSEIAQNPAIKVLRSDERDLVLPLNTLDQVRPFGATAPPPQGVIQGMSLAEYSEETAGKILVSSPEANTLSSGDTVEIRGTKHYNGLYTVTAKGAETFTIDAQFVNNEMGVWEKREDEPQGLMFDGMITSYDKTADGKLRVRAQNHGLEIGDQVQIIGTTNAEGNYPVISVDDGIFVIDKKWTAGEALNVKLESYKRRGIVFDGQNDYIELPPDAFPAGKEITICVWARGGETLPKDATFLEAFDKANRRIAYISLPAAAGGVYFDCGNGTDGCDRVGQTAQTADFKGVWTHWAFTKSAISGGLKIYRNGIPWSSAPGTRSIGEAARLRIGALVVGSPPGTLQCYEGTLADLSIYNRALSADEVRNSIYVPPSGQEPGLLGYWRLGAVVEGEVRKVTDISPSGRDGTVFGGATCGGVTLPRKLRDDTTLAVRYGNDELVAVTQRATYIEEIDFRVMANGQPLTKAALQNVDGSGKPVFQFRYWGKRSRSAEDKIAFDPPPPTQPLVDLGGGWIRATCRITIPDTISLLRSFEITDVRGTWEKMDIHRHAIRIISDAVTESVTTEAPVLSSLADAGTNMATKLKEIGTNELQEAQYFAEKLALEAKLALLADADYLKTERDATVKEVEALTRDVAAAEAYYNEQKGNIFNYFAQIQRSDGVNQYFHLEVSGWLVMWSTGHQFEWVSLDPSKGVWGIKARGENTFLWRDGSGRVAHGNGRRGGFTIQRVGDAYTIRDVNDGQGIHREGGTDRMIIYTVPHTWKLILGDPCNSVVANAKTDWDNKLKLLNDKKKRLDELNALLDPNTPQRSALEQRLKELSALLVSLQSSLATANVAYLDGVKALQQGALSMPTVATDRRGLLTTAALLGFVRPASRVSILETCEGNVQLTYVDAENRMRITHYDATADSRNNAFEQWITDAGRACLSLTKLGTAATIATGVPLSDTWAVEAWVLTPLPTYEWICLAGAQDQKNAAIGILSGSLLGMRSEGRFFSSGVQMESLSKGWHHVAAVKQGTGKAATVTFYVDGQKAGSTVQPYFSAMTLNGTTNAVELQSVSMPQSAEITVSFWARSAAQATPAAGTLIEAIDSQNRRILRIGIPDSAGSIAFDCGADATGLDSAEYKPKAPEHQGVWTHWAFTKNANTGLMRIYRNGRLWTRETGKTRLLTAATKVLVGKSASADVAYFQGDLSELCVWNKELSQSEIQSGLGKPVPVEDARLVGFWKFEGAADKAKAKDYSKTAKDGTLIGSPVMVEVATPLQLTLSKVGETVHFEPPPPLPPPLRNAVQSAIFDVPANTSSEKRIEFPPAVIPLGGAITICFWAKGGAALPKYNQVLEALDGNSPQRRICGIILGWADQTIFWDCGADAGGFDRISKVATAAEYKDTWAHWAFTKNAATGEMKIYRNGVLWASGTGKTKPITPPQRVCVGRGINETAQTYSGELAELSIWDKELSLAELTNVRDRQLVGNESNLVGYWSLGPSGATDLGPAKRNGTYYGSLAVSPAVPQPTMLFFDGTDDHVVIPEMNVDYSLGITLETWVYYDKYNPNARILDFGGGQAMDNIVLWNVSSSSTLRLTIFRGGTEKSLDAGVLETGKWIHIACTVDAAGNAKIYKNGVSVATGVVQLPNNISRTKNYLGRSNWPSDAFFSGKMTEVRIWNRVRSATDIAANMNRPLIGSELGLVAYWSFGTSGATDATAGKRNGTYAGGARLDPSMVPQPLQPLTPAAYVPLPPTTPAFKLSELRIWGTTLDEAEVAVNSKTLLSGNEPGLLAYLPMSEASGTVLADATGSGKAGTVVDAMRWACAAPIGYLGPGQDGVVAAEYSAVILDSTSQRKSAIMRRFFGSASNGAVIALPEKRIEELDVVWIGNAQFAPTLLGYIEGAPPVPSENLTEDFSYNGATSVELVTSEDVEFSWNQSQEIGAGLSLDTFIGADNQMLGGIGVMSKTLEFRAGIKANLNLGFQWNAETNITTTSTNRMTDRLELRGTPEVTAKFPHIGKRFIPKNVGYALVVSGMADVFVSRLRRSGKMVGYQMSPVEGVPPDVNTITFLMNPAYVMAGSLDGLTGSHATSDRFHKHVPAMRAQYGSLYPASYFRLKEAYALKQQIEAEDKRREAFFAQFSTATAFSASGQIDDAAAPKEVGVSQGGTAAEQQAAQSEQQDAAGQKQAEIDRLIGDPSRKANASSCFNAWQKKLERLVLLAGKRNIVNTYVWDADGGLRTEAQSFASTAQHTIGGSFSADGALGLEYGLGASGAKVELTVLAQASLTQTLNKSRSTTTGIELNVDLSGVESIGVTNHDDLPILPGEKVDRYRFMTFYLEGTTKNFNDFWSYVVDPEWLRSNGEEARALRQAMGKANKTWRVLHRVTYVERPALMGFGRDVRSTTGSDTSELVSSYFAALESKQQALITRLNDVQAKLDQIMTSLKTASNP